jgi:class 3 adenylate cyclase
MLFKFFRFIRKCIVKDKICTCEETINIDRISSLIAEIPTNHENVCICMIDIVKFSNWCNDKCPETIFSTMTSFNQFLLKHIFEFECVNKIELVGDSVLIIAGMQKCLKHIDFGQRVQNIISLVINILTNINHVQDMFKDQNISLRVGIHVGNVFSGFIENPKKLQVFGNSINVASRMESYSIPGTFTISTEAFNTLHPSSIGSKNQIIGPSKICRFKGIGDTHVMTGFIHKNEILIADDDWLHLEIFQRICINKYKLKCILCDTINETFRRMKENTYDLCILDVHFTDNIINGSLQEFRDWEFIHRKKRQKIALTTIDIDKNILQTFLNNVDYFIDKTEICNYSVYPTIG